MIRSYFKHISVFTSHLIFNQHIYTVFSFFSYSQASIIFISLGIYKTSSPKEQIFVLHFLINPAYNWLEFYLKGNFVHLQTNVKDLLN